MQPIFIDRFKNVSNYFSFVPFIYIQSQNTLGGGFRKTKMTIELVHFGAVF